jgi:hypothetical protein
LISNLNEDTIKSIIDQSVKINEIGIETYNPEYVSAKLKPYVVIHPIGTTHVRESEHNTVVFDIINGKIYPFDYIEKSLKNYVR